MNERTNVSIWIKALPISKHTFKWHYMTFCLAFDELLWYSSWLRATFNSKHDAMTHSTNCSHSLSLFVYYLGIYLCVCLCMMRTINLMFLSRLIVDVPASNICPRRIRHFSLRERVYKLKVNGTDQKEWNSIHFGRHTKNEIESDVTVWMNSDAFFYGFGKCDVISFV